jgi:hypothetical protein
VLSFTPSGLVLSTGQDVDVGAPSSSSDTALALQASKVDLAADEHPIVCGELRIRRRRQPLAVAAGPDSGYTIANADTTQFHYTIARPW